MNSTLPSCCTRSHDYIYILQELPLPQVQAYFSIFICTVGVVTNSLNIIVFNKNTTSSLNEIFCSLAVCDLIISLIYIPYFYKVYAEPSGFSETKCLNLPWIIYLCFFFYAYLWFHCASTWLTVLATVWRYIAVAYPMKSRIWCSSQRTRELITIILLTCLAHSVLMMVQLLDVKETSFIVDESGFLSNATDSRNVTFYTHVMKETATRGWLFGVLFVVSTFVFHFVPSILLSVISVKLWYDLSKAEKLQNKLKNSTRQQTSERRQLANRSTKMLIMISLLCLITQIPLVINNILNATIFFDKHYYEECAFKGYDLYQILIILNSACIFFIYYFMSSKFRDTFKSLFKWDYDCIIGIKWKKSVAINDK